MIARRPWTVRAGGRQKPKIDITLPGYGAMVGRADDRFRVSSETRDPDVYRDRIAMLRRLWKREFYDLVAAVGGHRCTLARLHVAYALGDAALAALASSLRSQLVVPLLDKYGAERRRKDWKKTRRRVVRFLARHGGDRATTACLTRANIAEFLAELTRANATHGEAGTPVAGATFNRYRAALSGFCTWLVANGYLERHPIAFKAVERVAEAAPRMPVLSSAQIADYVAGVARWGDAERTLAIRVMLATGADVSEVVDVRVRALDVAADVAVPRLTFRRSKTRTPERRVPIARALAAELRAHVARLAHATRPTARVFPGLSARRLETVHAAGCTAAGIDDFRLKDLRHIAAQTWRRAGVDLPEIQKRLGHATIGQTMVYADFLPPAESELADAERAAALLLGGALPPAPRPSLA